MPIIKAVKAGNGVTANYHKVAYMEADFANDSIRVGVSSFYDEASALDKLPTLWQHHLTISAHDVMGTAGLSAGVELALTQITDSPFLGGEIAISRELSLDELKVKKRAEITRARLSADSDHFIYNGKEIRTADKDMLDLLTTNSYVTLFGGFDEDWPGGWKAVDNSYVAIATIEEWKPFFKAMYKKGIANFRHSQRLKSFIDAATGPEGLAAIYWGMPDV